MLLIIGRACYAVRTVADISNTNSLVLTYFAFSDSGIIYWDNQLNTERIHN